MTFNVRDRFGQHITLENCIVGQNLNLISIRGYAPLHVLAGISGPDVFDQVTNPQGTQRDLSVKRSKEALAYAMDSLQESPDTTPRAFTEVILNVRDKSVVSIFDEVDGAEVDFSSTDALEDVRARRVSVKIDLSSMNFPQPETDPYISRVDGNHRLSSILELDDEILNDDSSIPSIAFSLFVGLSALQERAVFRDINSKQAKMETAHLDQISLSLEQSTLLLDQHKQSWALWVANELSKPGKVFDGLVFFGGSKRGLKAVGAKPVLKINALRDMIRYSIDDAIERQFFIIDPTRAQQMTAPERAKEVEENGQLFSMIIEWYWLAVKKAFPEAWQNKKDFILFQSVGLYAFGALAARLIVLANDNGKLEKEYFESMMIQISRKVDLSKSNKAWEGVAGLTGGKKVLKALESAVDLPGANLQQLRGRILPAGSPLDD